MAIPIPLRHDSLETDTMRAAVYTRYGSPDVIQVQHLSRPEPRPHEVRVRVEASTVTSACTMMRRGDTLLARVVLGPFGPRKRFQIAGIEFAGTIERIGAAVTDWHLGDKVHGFAGFNVGTYAEYFCMPASGSLARMPQTLGFGEAATLVDGPTTALYFLVDLAHVRRGERVLIVGASGSVGSAAVQVARWLGAHTTGVCSTANVDLVHSLGADEVIDYTKQDFTRTGPYDVIFDAVTKSSFSRCKPCLRAGGRYMPTVARVRDYLLMAWTKLLGQKRVICGMSVEKRQSLEVVKELLEQGALRPIVDRTYPLEHIAQAHRYVDTGRKRGNVVLDMRKVSI